MNEKLEYLKNTFDLARINRLCKNQKEFADLIGINRSSLSLALNGTESYLTDNLIVRLKLFRKENGLEDMELATKPAAPVHDTRPDIVIPAATMDLYTSMAKSIDRLTSLVERLHPGASAFSGAYTQKNPLTDRK